MTTNKILSASLIDLIFDGRNKDYGAYELRATYSKRTKLALVTTISIAAIVISVVTMAGGNNEQIQQPKNQEGVVLTEIEEKIPEEIPEPEPIKQPEPEPTRTITFTPPEIVPDDKIDKPMPDIASLDSNKIDTKTQAGKPDIFTDPPKDPGNGPGIIDIKPKEPVDEIRTIVEVPAKFKDNWVKFLLKHLDPETPVKNGAEPGRYSVVIQFVVDKEGNISDLNPLTKHGHGMEEEAMRVLKKSPQWQPAFQNGHTVKAYHRQIITFEVNPEE